MTGVIATIPRIQFSNSLGLPLAGGKLTTYLAGTTTPEPTYQDQALTIENPTTITLDSTGSCVLWLDPDKSYKFLLKSALGVTQPGWPVDNINGASNLISLQPTLGLYAKLSAMAAAVGSSLLGFIQAGAGAVKRTVQDELRDRVSVKQFGAVGDGVADDTAAFNKALAVGKEVFVPAGTYRLSSTVTLGPFQRMRGAGKGNTTLSFVGAGTCLRFISPSGSGVRIYSGGLADFMVTTSTGALGIDLDSISESDFERVIVAGFSDAGIRLHSGISGGAVYNRFLNVKTQACGKGFDLSRDGGAAATSSYTNDNTFLYCRANACDIGVDISGGNHNVFMHPQIEVCKVGFQITEPVLASMAGNTIAFARFENNTETGIIGPGVVGTVIDEPSIFSGPAIVDNGVRTQFTGSYGTQLHCRQSARQNVDGSFRYTRTANGGFQTPNMVFEDVNSIGSGIVVESRSVSASPDARLFRGKYGVGSNAIPKFGVVPVSGKITDLPTVNGPTGGFTMDAAQFKTISNTCISAGSRIFLQAVNADAAKLMGSSKALYPTNRVEGASFQVNTGDGTVALGTELFWYWIVN